jgi:hypothetical protein
MSLSEYDQRIKPRLELIAAGAEMAARHARALPFKPGFTTRAEDELAESREVLEAALRNVIAAQAVITSKPTEADRAA